MYYRNHQYGLAAQQYEQGLKAIRDNGDIKDPLYARYYKLWEDSVAKDKRYNEILKYVGTLVTASQNLDEETIKKGIAYADEGLKIVPNSSQLGEYRYKLNWMLSEIQRKKQQQAQCEAKWAEGVDLYNAKKYNEALVKFKENLACNPGNQERQRYVAELERRLADYKRKKNTADRLWDECVSLTKQGRNQDALDKCRESLAYWSDDKRKNATAQLESAINQKVQKKAAADRLWDECLTLAKQNRLNEALSKCRESLNYWSSEKRVAAVRDMENAVKQGEQKLHQPPAPPVTPPVKPPVDTASGGSQYTDSQFYHVDLTPYGGKKGTPRKVKNIEVDDGSWVRLKATHEKRLSLEINLPQQVKASAIAVVSNLDNAHNVPDDFTTTVLIVRTTAGERRFEIKAGVHSSEWNRSKTGGATHRWPKETNIGGSRWMAVFQLPSGSAVTSIRFEHRDTDRKFYHGDAAPGFCLRGITLIKSDTAITTTDSDNVTKKANVIFNNGNISGVYNNPTKPTIFTISQPYVITKIVNYHWNNARAATPGTIALRDQSGRTYGPWQSKGSPGQGGVPNAYWTVYPNITLPAGTYTVIDSQPSTWAQNSGSGGAGHTQIEGYPVQRK